LQLLGAISRNDLDSTIDADQLEQALLNLAGPAGLDLAKASYRATLLRAIEMALTSHPSLLSIIRAPQVYLGSESEEIRAVLEPIFQIVPEAAVNHLVSLVRSKVAHQDAKADLEHAFVVVLQRDFSIGAELRCAACGYHFQACDLGQERLDTCQERRLRLADRAHPRRVRDPWKPARDDYRRLTLDHVLPEAALGPAVPSNLQLLCGFCNKYKRITRRYEELLVSRAAASLLAVVGGSRGQWAYEAAVFFSLLWRPQCTEPGCGDRADSTELTAVPCNRDRRWTGLLPWQVETRCYEHSEDF